MVPKIYVVERSALEAWKARHGFELTFDETSQFIHDLQDAMIDQRKLSNRTPLDFFILVIPKNEEYRKEAMKNGTKNTTPA